MDPPRAFPNWLRQRVEAIIWTLGNYLGERHGGPAAGTDRPAPARAQHRNLAQLANRCPIKRSLIAYDH
jgi:hypothetical protein